VNVNRLSKPHWWQECLRSAPTTKCVLAAALLISLALGAPVHADDPIAEWLKQDESDGQNDQVRPDLHALTDQQLQDIFKIGRDQADSHQLIERGSEQHPRVLYIWIVTIAAGFGAVIGAVKAVPFVRRQLRTGPSANEGSKLTPTRGGRALQKCCSLALRSFRKKFIIREVTFS
jgi:hypothetical protein